MKTSKLTDAALDWAVWTCTGGAAAYPKTASGKAFLKLWSGNSAKYIHPSTDWAQGGPIIEREFIEVMVTSCGAPADGVKKDTWNAMKGVGDADAFVAYGPTPLVAAMRCFVASRLGAEVDVPEELR